MELPTAPTARIVTLDQLLDADREKGVERASAAVTRAMEMGAQPPSSPAGPALGAPEEARAPVNGHSSLDAGSSAATDADGKFLEEAPRPRKPPRTYADPAEETRRLLDLWSQTKSSDGYGA